MFLKWQYFSIVHITSTAYSIRLTSGEIHYKAKSNPVPGLLLKIVNQEIPHLVTKEIHLILNKSSKIPPQSGSFALLPSKQDIESPP